MIAGCIGFILGMTYATFVIASIVALIWVRYDRVEFSFRDKEAKS